MNTMQNAFMNRTTLLESVIESLPYGLIVASEEGILLLANNLGRTYLDLPEGEGFLLEEYLTVIPGLSDHLVFPLKEAFPSPSSKLKTSATAIWLFIASQNGIDCFSKIK